jgi:hypothetical protein
MAPVSESHSEEGSFGWETLLMPLRPPYPALALTVILLMLWIANRRRKQATVPNNYMIKQLLDPLLVSDLPPPLRSRVWQHPTQHVGTERMPDNYAFYAANMSSYRYSNSEKGPWRRHSYPVSTSDSVSPTQILSDDTEYHQCTDNADEPEALPKPMLWRRRTIVFESPFSAPLLDISEDNHLTGPCD